MLFPPASRKHRLFAVSAFRSKLRELRHISCLLKVTRTTSTFVHDLGLACMCHAYPMCRYPNGCIKQKVKDCSTGVSNNSSFVTA